MSIETKERAYATPATTMSDVADEIEHRLAMELEEKVIARSVLFTSGDRNP